MTENKLKVLFVCIAPKFRCYKMAGDLMRTGECETHLLAVDWDEALEGASFATKTRFSPIYSKQFRLYRMADLVTSGKADALSAPIMDMGMKQALSAFGDIDIIHTLAPPVTLNRYVIRNSKIPVVFDQYDLILQSEGEDHMWSKELADEKFCMENADGLVHKGPPEEIEFYRNSGYSISSPEMSFPDGCDETLFQPIPGKKLRDADNHWHVVYAGGIHGPGKDYYLLPFFEKLMKQGIHVHVYPAPWSRDHESLDIYHETAGKSGFLHMHDTVPYPDLVKDISRYDFGLYYFEFDDLAHPDLARKAKTAAGNKIPTYYEAGIPVIIAKKIEYSASFITQDRSGILIGPEDVPNLSKILEECDYRALADSVSVARKHWSGSDRAKQLVAFYRRILRR